MCCYCSCDYDGGGDTGGGGSNDGYNGGNDDDALALAQTHNCFG